MRTATIRLPEHQRYILKVIAGIEKRKMKESLSELIDEYTEQHKETLEILSKQEWVEAVGKRKGEVAAGIRGKPLDDLAG